MTNALSMAEAWTYDAAVADSAEEQACLDLADLILQTASQVDRFAKTVAAPGELLMTHSAALLRTQRHLSPTHSGQLQASARAWSAQAGTHIAPDKFTMSSVFSAPHHYF